MKITLYHFDLKDRGTKIRWLLNELETPYEVVMPDWRNLEHKQPSFLSMSPMGKVPVMRCDDIVLFEAGAIAIFLTERITTPRRLAPPLDSPLRADFLKWIVFSVSTLEPLLIPTRRMQGWSEEEKRKLVDGVYVGNSKESGFKEPAEHMERILSNSQFMIGGEFSAADIILAQPLHWASMAGLLERYPAVAEYTKRLRQRPAFIASGALPVIPA